VARTVGMYDEALGVMHRPGSVHLRTACGVALVVTTVGPLEHLEGRATRAGVAWSWCPTCWPGRGAQGGGVGGTPPG
jgi:hypothetical protein